VPAGNLGQKSSRREISVVQDHFVGYKRLANFPQTCGMVSTWLADLRLNRSTFRESSGCLNRIRKLSPNTIAQRRQGESPFAIAIRVCLEYAAAHGDGNRKL
jgi:hypothetical protein